MAKKPGKEKSTEEIEEVEETEVEEGDEEAVEVESEVESEVDEEVLGESESPKTKGKKVDITGGARKSQATHENNEELKGVVDDLKNEVKSLTSKIESFFTEKKKVVKKTDPPKTKKEPKRDMYGFRYEWDKDSE